MQSQDWATEYKCDVKLRGDHIRGTCPWMDELKKVKTWNEEKLLENEMKTSKMGKWPRPKLLVYSTLFA